MENELKPKVFNMPEAIELLQSSYEEAERLRQLAWDRVGDAMLANCPLKVGDTVRLENQYYPRNNGKVLGVKHMWINRGKRYYTKDSPLVWQVRAQLFPIKKDGTMAIAGEFTIDSVIADLASGKIVILTPADK